MNVYANDPESDEIVDAEILCGELGPHGRCDLPYGHCPPHAQAVLVTW